MKIFVYHPCTKTVQEWQVGLTSLICSRRFSVNKRIFVVGFGLYGSIHGPTDYQVNIQVILSTMLKIFAAVGTNLQILGNMQQNLKLEGTVFVF